MLVQLLCVNLRTSVVIVPKDEIHVGWHPIRDFRRICGIVPLIIIALQRIVFGSWKKQDHLAPPLRWIPSVVLQSQRYLGKTALKISTLSTEQVIAKEAY